MKHTWTESEALNYIHRCNNSGQKKGLKYCSAQDFIKNHTAAVRTADGVFSESGKQLIVETHIETVLASSDGE